MAYDYSQAGWSPEVVDYANRLAAQRDELVGKYAGMNTGLDNPDFLTPMQVQQPASDEIRSEYMPEEAVRAFMAKYPTISEAAFNPGVDIISYGASRDPAVYDVVRAPYGVKYTYTDKAADKSGMLSTPEELGAFAKSRNLATGRGNNVANWELTDPSGKRLASDLPYTPSLLKQAGQGIADALPAALLTSALGPAGAGLWASGAWAAPALANAGITSLIDLGRGKSLEDSLLSGLKSGAANYATSAFSDLSGLSSLGGAGARFDKTMSFGDRLALLGGSTTAVPLGVSDGIERMANVFTPSTLSPSFSGFGGLSAGALSSLGQLPSIPDAYSAPSDDGVEKVTVPGTRVPTAGVSPLPIAASALTDLNYDTGEQLGYGDKPTTEAPKEDGEGLSTSDYIRLGLTGASLLGGLFSGTGSKGGAGTIPQGFSTQLPSTFSAKLPTGSAIPAFGGGVTPESRMGRTATDLGDIDYTRYGFGPERSFFGNVPVRAAKGGPMAVQNISDGRSDDIPAVLSDGEYVIDAETVALLGDGSSKAGAQRLDQFRANIRKQKGKALSQGKVSPDARAPEQYLMGGRA